MSAWKSGGSDISTSQSLGLEAVFTGTVAEGDAISRDVRFEDPVDISNVARFR